MVTRYGPCPSLVRSRIINNLWFPPMISFFLFLFFFFFFCLHAHTPRAPRTCKCSPEALVTFSGARSVCETTFAAGHVRALFLSRRGREIWHFTSHSENRSGRCPFFLRNPFAISEIVKFPTKNLERNPCANDAATNFFHFRETIDLLLVASMIKENANVQRSITSNWKHLKLKTF